MLYFDDTRTQSNLPYLVLVSGEFVVFGSEARWTNLMPGGHALVTTGGSRIIVRGSLVADGDGITSSTDVQPVYYGNQIEIAAGTMIAAHLNAINLRGSDNFIMTAGTIGGGYGVTFSNSGNTIGNDGAVTGASWAVQFGVGSASDNLSNTGILRATDGTAVLSLGSGYLSVSNSGTISALVGSAVVHDVHGATTRIVNDGLIEGVFAISLGSGYDQVFNTGTIVGDVTLGGGNDRYEGVAGLVTGSVSGGDGNDLLVGGATGEWLSGGDGIDTLNGGGGNDVLNGGAGIDDLDGGEGRDRAVYDDAGGLTVDLEFQELNTGSAAGDILDSVEGVVVTGGASQLFGDSGRNLLIGGGEADLLDGRGDVDRMAGGAGNDIYVVDHRRDRIVEYAGGGSDLVRASSNYVLPDQVEALTLTGSAGIDATGNALANALTGNTAANVLRGLLGSDTLTGGGGVDIFRFDTALGIDVDTITDFAGDRLQLSRSVFTEVNNGTVLAETRFVTGSAAGDPGDRIIHNATTGEVFYDPDGTGAAAQVLFARLTPGTDLTYADVLLVA